MSSLRLCCWNAHSLDLSKEACLFNFSEREKIDFIGVSETWRNYDMTKYAGYHAKCLPAVRDRRGIAVFTKQVSRRVDRYTAQTEEFACLSVILNGVLIMMVYIPNGNVGGGMSGVLELFELAKIEYSRIIIVGDLNCRMNIIDGEGNNHCGRLLLNRLREGDMCRVPIDEVTFPRNQSCLDHVLTYGNFQVKWTEVIQDSWSSDHRAVCAELEFELTDNSVTLNHDPRTKSTTNWERVAVDLDRLVEPFEEKLVFEEQVNTFIELHKRCVKRRSRPLKQRSVAPIHFDSEIRALLKKRRGKNWKTRIAIGKEIRKKMRQLSRKAWTDFCRSGIRDNSGKQLWSMFKKSRGGGVNEDAKTLEEIQIMDANDKAASEMFGAAHILSAHIAAPLKSHIPKRFYQSTDEKFEELSEDELDKILKSLPNKASTGPDQVSNFLLKQSGENVRTWLIDVINYSMRTGEVCDSWKVANVKALAKASGGFRPISLISNLAKLVERVIVRRVTKFCREQNVIPDHQYASQGGTSVALSKLIDYVMDSEHPTYCVFFDVRKAFDRVHIPTLLQMIDEFEFPTYLGRWLRSYLLSRRASVGKYKYKLANGVPQGSVLGPVLFQIYVSQVLQDLSNVYCAAYADDFVIACHSSSWVVVKHTLQHALDNIAAATQHIGVELDARKTKAMWLWKTGNSRKAKKIFLKLGTRKLSYAETYKYLGVQFDRRLTYSSYIKKKLAETKKRGNYVFRLAGLTKRPLRSLWRGYAESYLVYGLPEIWDLLSDTAKDKCRSVYAAAARRIANLPKFTPQDIAIFEAGLSDFDALLHHRRDRPRDKNGKKIRLRADGFIDFPDGPNARHIETNYARWRTGYLWTNGTKFNFGLRKNGKCRLCKKEWESQRHVLLHCTGVSKVKREEYLVQVGALYNLTHPDDVTMEQACGQLLNTRQKQMHFKLAKLLTEFLDGIQFFV